MKNTKNLFFVPFVIIFCEITLYLSNDMYLPSMPTIAADLSFTQHQIQATLTAWFLGASAFQLFLGPISDRYGRRRVLIFGYVFFVLASAACAMAHSLAVMLLSRFVQGATICSLVAASAAIHELYSTKKAIKLLAWIGAVTILAPGFGPLFGALLTEFAHWRYIFWFLFVMGVLSVLSLVIWMPESNHIKHPLHILTIVNDYLRILSNKNFLKPTFSYFFLAAVYFFWIFESPFIMMQLYKTTPLYYGIAQTVIFSFYFIGAAATEWLLNRYRIMSLIQTATGITISGAVLFFAGAILDYGIVLAIAAMCIISFGSSMLFGPLNRIAVEACSQPMGRITALFSTFSSLSGAITGVVLHLLYDHSLYILSIMMMVCMFFVIWLMLVTKVSERIKTV